ncbi:MAG: sensor histidine kinase, partial [Alphaproteobacteria bacterium]
MKLRLPGKPSLVRRLILLATVWSLAVLIVAGFVLGAQFERASIDRLDTDLGSLADGLSAGINVEKGELVIPEINDERFTRTFAGRYWQIAEVRPDGDLVSVARSRSLGDTELVLPPSGLAGLQATNKPVPYDATGPVRQSGLGHQPLRASALFIRIGDSAPLIIMVGEDRTAVDREIRTFRTTTAIALILLGLFIVAGVWIQVRVGLQPIFDLRREIAEVR